MLSELADELARKGEGCRKEDSEADCNERCANELVGVEICLINRIWLMVTLKHCVIMCLNL